MPDVIMYRYVKDAKKTTINEFDIVNGVQTNIKTYEVTEHGAKYIAKHYPKHVFFHVEAQPDYVMFPCFAETHNHEMIHEFLARKQ